MLVGRTISPEGIVTGSGNVRRAYWFRVVRPPRRWGIGWRGDRRQWAEAARPEPRWCGRTGRSILGEVGRKGTGRFRISGELKLTFIGAGTAFFETRRDCRSQWLSWTCALLKKSATRDRNRERNGIKRIHRFKPHGPAMGPLQRRDPTIGSYGFDCLWRTCQFPNLDGWCRLRIRLPHRES
jgi:hypothetical protein